MSDHAVYRDNALHVCAVKCSTCIFRPGNLMRLENGRRDSMASGAVKDEGVIVCHKTISGEDVGPAVCRGYFDVHKNDVQGLQVAERLGMIREINPDQKEV